MDDKNTDMRESVSALADGQLTGEAFERALAQAADGGAGTEAWHLYHLVGDVLRSGELAPARDANAFVQRLRVRLADEPAPGAAIDLLAARAVPVRAAAAFDPQRPAANDGSMRWKLAAGFASVAAVAAIGWTAVGGLGTPGSGAQLAQSAAPAPATAVATSAGTMMRDPRLDELLAAHRRFAGATALQAPAGFLRNATFEGPAR